VQVRAALPALRPPACVQRVALGTSPVHRTREELGRDGARPQNPNGQGDVQQRLAHESSLSERSPRRTDGIHVEARIGGNYLQFAFA
jgi:hypothetical protein